MREIESLQEIKKNEYAVLKYLDKVCREEKLRYWLAYGTLIGAVRHEGFIPWDDDIDVFMPRQDYIKFLSYMKKQDGRYKLSCIETVGRSYRYSYGKLHDSMTYVNESVTQGNCENGIWVDIFPIDGLGDEKSKDTQFNRIYENSKRINFFHTLNKYGLKGKILKLIGRTNINRYLNWTSGRHTFDESKYVAVLTTVIIPPYKPTIWKREWFDKTVEMHFENGKFFVPGEYDKILKSVYGNYMELPPEDERVQGHSFKAYWKE